MQVHDAALGVAVAEVSVEEHAARRPDRGPDGDGQVVPGAQGDVAGRGPDRHAGFDDKVVVVVDAAFRGCGGDGRGLDVFGNGDRAGRRQGH
ncbi:hypothetical protein DSECCO2_581740 [anaerobic digester metagenome]